MRRTILFILALAALVSVATYAAFTHDLDAAGARLKGRSETAETAFGRVEYAVEGEGEPVLVIHGAAGGFDQALEMSGGLTARGFRLIAPSRFGYLRSGRPSGLTTEMQADAYAALLDRLGVQRVSVVAISAGAWSALQFAARHPERCRALVLLVPADYLPAGEKMRGGPLSGAMFKSDFVAWGAIKASEAAPGLLSETMLGTDAAVLRAAPTDEQARVRRTLAHLLPIGPRSEGMRFDIQTAAWRQPYPITRIACPVLAISAEDDRFGTAGRARTIAAAAPGARRIIYLTGGHALVGRYAEALEATAAFLSAAPP